MLNLCAGGLVTHVGGVGDKFFHVLVLSLFMEEKHFAPLIAIPNVDRAN